MHPDEHSLIHSCQQGNLADFDGLYTRHLKGVYAFVFYRVMDKMTAEDLTSQTFIKALESIGSYDARKGAFSTWLYRIARNTVTDFYRTNRPHSDVDVEEVWDIQSDDNPFLKLVDKLSAEQIHKVLKAMPKEKRAILMMRLWDNLSYKEIADLTGKSEAACKMTFMRTLESLRTELSPTALTLLLLFNIFQP